MSIVLYNLRHPAEISRRRFIKPGMYYTSAPAGRPHRKLPPHLMFASKNVIRQNDDGTLNWLKNCDNTILNGPSKEEFTWLMLQATEII